MLIVFAVRLRSHLHCLMQVKREYYGGMAHYHAASGVLHEEAECMSAQTKDTLQFLHTESMSTQLDIRVPKDGRERKLLGELLCPIVAFYHASSLHRFTCAGRAHLREALVLQEECQRLHRMCRELKGKQALASVLRAAHKTTLQMYTSNETEDDFRDLLDAPQIQGNF